MVYLIVASIGMIVVDELHLLGGNSRGALLEIMLTKLKMASADVQIVGMSATIENIDQIALVLYQWDFFPLFSLTEYYSF